jgi:phage protein D
LPTSELRTPSLTVLAGGVAVPGVMDLDIFANAHLGAGRFRFRAAIPAVTAASLLDPGTVLDLQLAVGGYPVSLLQGEADAIHVDVIQGTLEVEGRDLTGRLLDARTQETFANQTASEIATTLAGRHSLTPVVTATTTLAGRYYGAEHDRIVLGQFSRATTEWDLLTFLAAREGFEVFVAAQSLYFQPLSQTAAPTILTPGDCLSLSLERSLTLARDIEVTVQSWNTRHQAAFSQTARSAARGRGGSGGGKGSGGSGGNGPPQRIVVVRPNLTPNAALQLAQRILADLSGHERLVHAELPGELTLTPRSQITLTGTGTDFDQTYYIAGLDRHFSVQHGFTERLRLKNPNPVNSAAAGTDDSNAVGST